MVGASEFIVSVKAEGVELGVGDHSLDEGRGEIAQVVEADIEVLECGRQTQQLGQCVEGNFSRCFGTWKR